MNFDELEEANPKLIYIGDTVEKFKDALVGITEDYHHLIYSYGGLIKCMMEIDGMTREEAEDWMGTNTLRSLPYYGEFAPIVMIDIE